MKTIKYILIGLCTLTLSSCEDFLNTDPENQVPSDGFLSTENGLKLYTNGFLQAFLPQMSDIAWGGDEASDMCAVRTSSTFLRGDTWDASQQGGWSWGDLRQVNYYLDNLPAMQGTLDDATYRHYEGIGRFWRAYFYYNMVKTFGDVPWYDHVLDVDDTDELYKSRDSRETVMSHVLEDLTYAATYCSSESEVVSSSTLVNKWVALAFKSRVCLFEGTYRKYHDELGLQSTANDYLREAVAAAEELMNNGPYSLVSTPGNEETQYRSLFNEEDLKTQEVIWGIAYQTDVRMHNATWLLFSGSAGSGWSMVKPFVNMYLMRDGSRFTDKPGYETMTYAEEFENRDCRLAQTVIGPDYQRRQGGVQAPFAPNFTVTFTGYMPIKWAIDDDAHDATSTSYNSIPILRYAEVLLNYAEAKAELGECDESVWNATIRLLRERAGVDGSVPATYDPYVAAYFNNQTTDKWILEIRRERGCEMAFEALRWDDLMRWKMGELIERTWQGIYVPHEGEVYDLNGDGQNDVCFVFTLPPAEEREAGVDYVEVDNSTRSFSEGDHGYIQYGLTQNRMWLDKKYLRPIPLSATQINPKLLPQNPDWE